MCIRDSINAEYMGIIIKQIKLSRYQMLAKIIFISLLFTYVFSQSCAGTACSDYCCPSTLQVCSTPAFKDICWGYCDASTTCGNSCCDKADECQKEKPGSFCVTNVYPYVGKTLQFPNIDWIYIEWYTVDNSKMTSTFATMDTKNTTIANFSTTLETNYFTKYGQWGATNQTNMQLSFDCKQYFEPCKVAYSIRGGVVGTSSQEE
eukprot:TRINITY_DN1262_c0_g1_i4.p2 TRINITY_DN1262_c0_g1~~TRINITY_DN1262_c0_g1_i4.p2  ORF type:complete len:205 (-),score=36.76 TRINITY_DN1262_c0_g1_i4:79-693(-)